MAPKKKKTIKNGFYYFMLEIQKEQASIGKKCSLNEASTLAHPRWEKMSLEERKPYNDKAAANGKRSDDLTQKFTSLGVSFAMVDAEEREKEEFHNMMIATIRSTVASLDRDTSLKTKNFFVCHVNYFYKTEDNYYAPAEFALAVFNLGSGILETMHFFIDPGKLPLGMKFAACDWSAKSHQIPVNDRSWTEGETDYYKLYERVRRFIRKYSDDTEMPPIYTMFDSLNTNYCHSAVRCALDNMCEAARMDPILFKVYNISILFYELRGRCSPGPSPSIAIVKSEIEKDVFSYAKDIACIYHEEKDVSVYCSLSMIIRWIFTICDHCCKHLGVAMKLGAHIPKEAHLNWKQESNYVKYSTSSIKQQTDSTNYEKPLVIIDHGKLKEKRVEEKRREEALYQKCENLRLPKTSFSNKIGANFSPNPASSHQTAYNSDFEDDENDYNECLGAVGGQDYTVNGRDERSAASYQDDEDDWTPVQRPRGAGHGRGRGIAPAKSDNLIPLSGRGRILIGSRQN